LFQRYLVTLSLKEFHAFPKDQVFDLKTGWSRK